ncbi:hypothetical protein Tco_0932324 [Tanacetum coccineum]
MVITKTIIRQFWESKDDDIVGARNSRQSRVVQQMGYMPNCLIKIRSKSVDERAALANLIANLTLDTEENKTVLKQLKKANASLTQELKECKTNLDESSRAT